MIFDCFTFFNELDLLEARLVELSDVVDYFVLVEAKQTHQGNPKPLIYKDNQSRFEAYKSKIIYLVCDIPPKLTDVGNRIYNDVWRREAYQRLYLEQGLINAKPEDLVIVSDVDEIISAKVLSEAIARRPKYSLTVFNLTQFEYFVNRKIEPWHQQGPRMIEKKLLSDPQRLRHCKWRVSKNIPIQLLTSLHARIWNYFNNGIIAPIYLVEDAGWHFSSLGGWEKWREKVNSFAHTEFKGRKEYSDKDLFEESLYKNCQILNSTHLPNYILQHSERFGGFISEKTN